MSIPNYSCPAGAFRHASRPASPQAGAGDDAAAGTPAAFKVLYWNFEFYVQDNWRVNSRLRILMRQTQLSAARK